jgi:hypothetical protein
MSNIIHGPIHRWNKRMMKRVRKIQEKKRKYEEQVKNWKPTYTVIKKDVK